MADPTSNIDDLPAPPDSLVNAPNVGVIPRRVQADTSIQAVPSSIDDLPAPPVATAPTARDKVQSYESGTTDENGNQYNYKDSILSKLGVPEDVGMGIIKAGRKEQDARKAESNAESNAFLLNIPHMFQSDQTLANEEEHPIASGIGGTVGNATRDALGVEAIPAAASGVGGLIKGLGGTTAHYVGNILKYGSPVAIAEELLHKGLHGTIDDLKGLFSSKESDDK